MDKKGYTLIEILAVISIIVLITASSTLLISGNMESQKEKNFRVLERQVLAATELYVNNMPEVSEKTYKCSDDSKDYCKVEISVAALQGSKLLSSELIDPFSNTYLNGNTKIIIFSYKTNSKLDYFFDHEYNKYNFKDEIIDVSVRKDKGNEEKSNLQLPKEIVLSDTFEITEFINFNGYEIGEVNKNDNEYEVNLISLLECNLAISEGTKGENNFYISDVTIKLNVKGNVDEIRETSIKYLDNFNFNEVIESNVDTLTISEDVNNKTYSGHVETVSGMETECEITISRDATPPLCTISSSGTTLTLSGSDNLGNTQVSWTSKETGFADKDNNLTSTGTRTINTYKGWVKDAAGNIGACEYQCGDWSGGKTGTCVNPEFFSDGITSYVDAIGSDCCAEESGHNRCKFGYRRDYTRTCQSVNVSP